MAARAAEIIRRFAPICSDPEEEARAIEESEMRDLPEIAEIAGARSFLASNVRSRATGPICGWMRPT
jgi:hypothetical protein